MSGLELWSWLALLGLGALHGANPGMGWLFAVALGLQERKARAVWRALPPLAAGHALAVGAALVVALVAGSILEGRWVRLAVAAALLGVGLAKLRRHRHPRLGGMRVNGREMTAWSFMMATAHGAGLMVLPVLLGGASTGSAHHDHAGHGPAAMAATVEAAGWLPTGAQAVAFGAAAVHTAGYLLATAVIALLVYRKLGLRLLGKLWINVDLLWAGALVVTAVLTVLV